MSQTIEAYLIDSKELTSQLLDDAAWRKANPVQLSHYWSGKPAPPERQSEARALWTSNSLFIRFDCQQHEPLVVTSDPQATQKTIGLWERDVCEIFIAPNANEPGRYFEFEASSRGEWLDLAIHQLPDKRETDWEYQSGMTVVSRVEDKIVTICIVVPFQAFNQVPQPGDRWRANLFRCVGTGEDRGYLAWQPTLTDLPNFHVPALFGSLLFCND